MKNNSDAEIHYNTKRRITKSMAQSLPTGETLLTDLSKSEDAFPGRYDL